MRKFLWFLVIVVVGYIAYSTLYRPASDEERQVKAFEDRFELARNRFLGTERQMANPGEADIADPEAAVRRLKKVKADFDAFYATLKDEKAVARADRLAEKIEEFFKKNDIE
jgi:hypothetical protein